jgi:hypothetical protein
MERAQNISILRNLPKSCSYFAIMPFSAPLQVRSFFHKKSRPLRFGDTLVGGAGFDVLLQRHDLFKQSFSPVAGVFQFVGNGKHFFLKFRVVDGDNFGPAFQQFFGVLSLGFEDDFIIVFFTLKTRFLDDFL